MTSPIVGENFPKRKKTNADTVNKKTSETSKEKQEPLAYEESVVDVDSRINELSAKLDSLMGGRAPSTGAATAGSADRGFLTTEQSRALQNYRSMTALALANSSEEGRKRIIEHSYATQAALIGSLDDMKDLYKDMMNKAPMPPEQQQYDETYDTYLTASMGIIANAFQTAAGAPAGAPSAGIAATTSGLESIAEKQQQNAVFNNTLYKSYSEAYKAYSNNMNSAFIKLVEKSTEVEKAMLDNSFKAYKAVLKARNENINQAINFSKEMIRSEVESLKIEQGRLGVNAQEQNKIRIANLKAAVENNKMMERATIARLKVANEDMRLINEAFNKPFKDLTVEDAALLSKIGADMLVVDPYDFERFPQQYRGSVFRVVDNTARELSDAKGAALSSLGAREGWDLSTENENAIKATMKTINQLAASGIVVNKEGAISIASYFDKKGDSEYVRFDPTRGVIQMKKPLTVKYRGGDGKEKTMSVASGQNIANAFGRADTPAKKDALSRALFGGRIGTMRFERGAGSNEIIRRMGSRISNLSNNYFIKNYREAIEEGSD